MLLLFYDMDDFVSSFEAMNAAIKNRAEGGQDVSDEEMSDESEPPD
jgi:hypothetical protein